MFTNSAPAHDSSGTRTGRRIAAGITICRLRHRVRARRRRHRQRGGPAPVRGRRRSSSRASVLGVEPRRRGRARSRPACNEARTTRPDRQGPARRDRARRRHGGRRPSVQTSLGGVVQVGAVGQYARRRQGRHVDGSDRRGKPDDGGVGIGKDKAVPGGNATVDLNELLGNRFAVQPDRPRPRASAPSAAQAQADGENAASGDYTLAGVDAEPHQPGHPEAHREGQHALDAVDSRLAVLDGPDGVLVADLNKLSDSLNPALNLLGANANVTATVEHRRPAQARPGSAAARSTATAASPSTSRPASSPSTCGKLLGGKLNNLAPGTEVLSARDHQPGPRLDHEQGREHRRPGRRPCQGRSARRDGQRARGLSLDIAQAPLVAEDLQDREEGHPGADPGAAGHIQVPSSTGSRRSSTASRSSTVRSSARKPRRP